MPRPITVTGGVHFKALREHRPWNEPHLAPPNYDGISGTKRGAGVPVRHRDVDDIIVRLVACPSDRLTGKVREILVHAGK